MNLSLRPLEDQEVTYSLLFNDLQASLFLGVLGIVIFAFGIWDFQKEWKRFKQKKENSFLIFIVSIPYSFFMIFIGTTCLVLSILIYGSNK